jgi:single-strand DNA-binding protein
MNVFTFSGNLGRDAELRYTAGGDSAVSFSVAVKSGFGDKAVTSWIKCNLWGKRGESVMPYLKKGQLVGVSGEFSAREWQDKEGQTKISNEVRVNDVQLLGGRPQEQATETAKPSRPAPARDFSDDVPF